MILQNRSIDQDKSSHFFLFQKIFRTWTCLPCTLHLNMINKKKNPQKISLLLLFFLGSIFKYFAISTCNKPMNLSLSLWLVMYRTSKMSLHSPYFLSFTQQFLVFIFVQLLASGGRLLISACQYSHSQKPLTKHCFLQQFFLILK